MTLQRMLTKIMSATVLYGASSFVDQPAVAGEYNCREFNDQCLAKGGIPEYHTCPSCTKYGCFVRCVTNNPGQCIICT